MMLLDKDKVENLIKSSKLLEITLGWHLMKVCETLGLPDDFESMSNLKQQVPFLKMEPTISNIVLIFHGIEMYFAKESETLEYIAVDREGYYSSGLPPSLVGNEWDDFFKVLFSVKHHQLETFAKVNGFSMSGIKRNSLPYPKYRVNGSKTILSFCGKEGVGGLCRISIDNQIP